MEVKMNKEIMDYREAMFFGLDFRQMACSLLAVLAAVGIYFSLRKTAGEEVTGWLCMLGAAPFAFCGFFRYHGMTAEQFAWAVVKSELLYPKRLLFQPEDLYYQCMEGRIASGENGKREKKAEKLRRKELKKARKQAAARKRIQRKQTGRKQATRKRMDRERMNRDRMDRQTSGKRESREPIIREQRNRKQSGRMQAERDQMKKMRSGRKQCSRVQEEREHAVFMHPSGNPARGIRTDRSPRLEMGTVSTDQKRMDSKQSTGSRRNRMPTNQDQRNRTPAHRNPAQNQRNKSSIQQPIRRRRDASD